MLGWVRGDRKVPADAQIFNLLTDAAADSVLAAQLKDRPGHVDDRPRYVTVLPVRPDPELAEAPV